VIPSKCFKPDMKYWQIEHAGRFHPKVLNQTWSTDKLNIQEDSIQKFWIRHEEQTSWTYRVIPSKRFVPDIKYWQVEHTGWFNTKVWTRHEVLTNWTYKKIPSKSFEPNKLNIQGDSIQVLNQTWSTDKLNIKEDSI
jgi:hypothetical protein